MLLILDLNGVLCRRLNSKTVEYRPGVREFLAQCYHGFEVAFYSSARHETMMRVLRDILTEEQQKKTLFFWGRDRTAIDPGVQLQSDPSWRMTWPARMIRPHSTIKRLNLVFENPILNAHGKYGWSNTLIVDDDPIKLRFNPAQNCLIVPRFEGEQDYELAGLVPAINERFLSLTS